MRLEAMRKEATSILDRVDIQIAWRLVSENQGNEPFERLVVVKFTGGCACGGFLGHPRDSSPGHHRGSGRPGAPL